jgi:tRNA threonylcarbamoyladenosine modification (KEOPS) complex Cgi121 subunit
LTRQDKKPTSILTARQIEDAFDLYDAGANYVILPHFLGGEYTSKLIQVAKSDKRVYEKEKKKEIKLLEERLKQGQEHPKVEKNRGN